MFSADPSLEWTKLDIDADTKTNRWRWAISLSPCFSLDVEGLEHQDAICFDGLVPRIKNFKVRIVNDQDQLSICEVSLTMVHWRPTCEPGFLWPWYWVPAHLELINVMFWNQWMHWEITDRTKGLLSLQALIFQEWLLKMPLRSWGEKWHSTKVIRCSLGMLKFM